MWIVAKTINSHFCGGKNNYLNFQCMIKYGNNTAISVLLVPYTLPDIQA